MFRLFRFGKKPEERPEKCNSGKVWDKCNGCPISLGASYHESQIDILKMKMKFMQEDLDKQSANLEFPFLRDAEFTINACYWTKFPIYIYQNKWNKYYISQDKKEDKLIKTYVLNLMVDNILSLLKDLVEKVLSSKHKEEIKSRPPIVMKKVLNLSE